MQQTDSLILTSLFMLSLTHSLIPMKQITLEQHIGTQSLYN